MRTSKPLCRSHLSFITFDKIASVVGSILTSDLSETKVGFSESDLLKDVVARSASRGDGWVLSCGACLHTGQL